MTESLNIAENHGSAHGRRFQRAAVPGKDEVVIPQDAFGRRDLAARGRAHPLHGNAKPGAGFRYGLPVGMVAGVVTEDQRAPRRGRQRGAREKSRRIHSVADDFDAGSRSVPVSNQPAPGVQTNRDEAADVGMTGNLIVPCVDVMANEQGRGLGKSLNGLDGFQVMVSVNYVGSGGKAEEIGLNGDSKSRNFGGDLSRRRSIHHRLVAQRFHGLCQVCDQNLGPGSPRQTNIRIENDHVTRPVRYSHRGPSIPLAI